MLRIKQTWITSKHKAEIYKAQRTGPMRIYRAEKHGWTDAVFDMVSWDTMGLVRWKLTHTNLNECKHAKLCMGGYPQATCGNISQVSTSAQGANAKMRQYCIVFDVPTPKC